MACRLHHVQAASYKKPRDVAFVDEAPKRGFTPGCDALAATHGGGNYPGMWVYGARVMRAPIPAAPGDGRCGWA
ncbi:hypothetical protein ACIHFD_58670 [Nonomuraea sp. NPDC051941]|uniref:hypothetical protein n=1 Tax=Nonomuraea sp. NPDC051941 TaxID=3364373 RepID=UPI0037C73680